MSTPSTSNSTANKVNTGIVIAGDTGVQLVESLIISDVPALALPVIKQIWEAFFGWIAGYFIKAAEQGATFAVIDYQVGKEESDVSDALKALIAAEKEGNPDAIKKAIQNYANAQSALTNSDGSGTIQ